MRRPASEHRLTDGPLQVRKGKTMPIYEFYCQACHTVFTFFSRRIDTDTTPACPRCRAYPLSRQVSMFAVTGRAVESTGEEKLPFDEASMEKAMTALAREADHLDSEDPRQAANLMRRLTDMTGMRLGDGMSEALKRLEDGEDPDQIEAEMGDLLESEDPFSLEAGKPGARPGGHRAVAAARDETLYDLHPEN